MADILIVDDDSDINSIVQDILTDDGHNTYTAFDVSSAKAALQQREYDVIIVDIWLKTNNMDGIGLLKTIMNMNAETPVIMISGHATASVAALALKLGAYDFIEKPFKSTKLLLVVRRAIELVARIKKEQSNYGENNAVKILGTSQHAEMLRHKVQSIAKNSGRTLITGEFGTGKKHIAKIIHSLSQQANHAFTEIFISSNQEEERQLKYLQKLWHSATVGTILLRNVELFSIDAQDQIKELLHNTVISDANNTPRLICTVETASANSVNAHSHDHAYNHNIDPTLYSRLNINRIDIAPLRTRQEDIESILQDMMHKASKKFNNNMPTFDRKALSILLNYDWPGNISELANVAHHLCLYAKINSQTAITENDIPSHIHEKQQSITTNIIENVLNEDFKNAKNIFEKQYIEHQLKKFSGNIRKTADFIGVNRSALHRRLNTLNASSKASHTFEDTYTQYDDDRD